MTVAPGLWMYVCVAVAERTTVWRCVYVCVSGDAGDNFYVVEEGDFDILVNSNKVASRGPTTSFGELALLYNSPRAATVVSRARGTLWALDRLTFRHMLASSREDQLEATVAGLRCVSHPVSPFPPFAHLRCHRFQSALFESMCDFPLHVL